MNSHARTEIDPTSDALKSSTLTLYEVQSKYDEYAANQSVRRVGRSEVWYFMGKGLLEEAQKAMDEWSAKQPRNVELSPMKALLFAVKGDSRAAEAEIPIILSKHPLKDPLIITPLTTSPVSTRSKVRALRPSNG